MFSFYLYKGTSSVGTSTCARPVEGIRNIINEAIQGWTDWSEFLLGECDAYVSSCPGGWSVSRARGGRAEPCNGFMRIQEYAMLPFSFR